MSSDSAKENASVVDSSVSEWKLDIGNSDDPDKVECSHHHIGDQNGMGMQKLYSTRYFIIKSLNHQNIRLSVEKGVWATQIMNESILEEAFHNSIKVILIFSVNMSGYFQGYAQMMSSVGWKREDVWSEGSGKGNPWGRSFNIKWLRLNDLPFHKTLHLKNPLNDYKPVKISRDCQELTPDIGQALCELINGNNNIAAMRSSSPLDSFTLKGHSGNVERLMGNKDRSFYLPWSIPMAYPSLLCPNEAGANQRFNLTTSSETFPTSSGSLKVAGTKRPHFSANIPKLQVDKDVASQFDVWGFSAESPLASTLTEDDFLEMSYEEYLEVQSRCRKQFCSNAATMSGKQPESLRSKSDVNDRKSEFLMEGSSSFHRRVHQ
ncbi:uncharacterized protein LOC114757520 isoform X2 [Neltuma alba]|uniref:uncharacterized protein LOC114757520 isoform X2 n=1 Tax=Neltuma alba TaxID=207710 RepID=UPI0010A2CC6C|nr:uncharacterized protein LOC114757520 isoform X2 [Prosopis alba]